MPLNAFTIIKIIAALALVAAVAWGVHEYNDRLRQQGRDEVQSRWDAALAAQKLREADAAEDARRMAEKQYRDRQADFKALEIRNAALSARLHLLAIDHDVVTSLLDSVRTANAEGAGGAAKDSPAASGTAGDELAKWFAAVAELYRACREQVVGWIKWDDARVTN